MATLSKPFGNRKTYFLSLLIIITVNLIVFSPSFHIRAKGDHIAYLIETADIEDLTELINYSYSYCRTRVIYPGDRILFRPLFYVLLSLEKWLWGYNFIYWQITGFFFHIIILSLLLRALNTLQSHNISFLFVLFFSVLYIGHDLVTWHHMHGYLVFIILLLFSFIHFIHYVQNEQKNHKNLWSMIGCLLPAVFINEFGAVAAIIFWGTLLIHRKFVLSPRRKGNDADKRCFRKFNNLTFLFLPVIIYFYLSLIDFNLRFSTGCLSQGSNFFASLASPGKLLMHFVSLLLASFSLPVIPAAFMIFVDEKNYAQFMNLSLIMQYDPHTKTFFILNILLLLTAVTTGGMLIYNLSKDKIRLSPKLREACHNKQIQDLLIMTSLCSLMLTAYIFVLVFFRTSGKTLSYVSNNLYHFYILTIFPAIISYCIFFVIHNIFIKHQKMLTSLTVVVLVLGISLNASKVYMLNNIAQKKYAPWTQFIRELGQFVNEHKEEPGFSFFFVSRDTPNYFRVTAENNLEKKEILGYTSDFLFRRYINTLSPKYYLIFRQHEGIVPFQSQKEAEKYLQQEQTNRLTAE